MSEFKHQNSCQYADALVAYLYEEIGGKDKSVFETHLANCPTCADELAEFSAVRFSIGEWRETEFERFETPIVFIPELVRNSPQIESVKILETPSLLAQIRGFFSLSPARIGAVAAALVVCIGVVMTVSYLRNEPQIARKDTVPDVIAEKTSLPENRPVEITAPTDEFRESKPPLTVSQKTGARNSQNDKAVRTANLPSKESKNQRVTETRETRKPSAKPVLRKTNSPSPTLIADEDDYEDDSLRLSDLFREVGGG